MYRPARGRRVRLDQHVAAGYMPVLEPHGSDSPRDRFEIFPADRNIDILRERAGIGLGFLDIQVRGKATNDPVLQPAARKASSTRRARLNRSFTRSSKNVLIRTGWTTVLIRLHDSPCNRAAPGCI